jgi:hypothetical protein
MMNTQITLNSPTTPSFVACIGLDWGDQSHAVAMQSVPGKTESCTLVNSPEVLHHWLQQAAPSLPSPPLEERDRERRSL